MRKYKTKPLIAILAAIGAIMAVAGTVALILITRSGGHNEPKPTDAAYATEAPDAEYEMINLIRYWPEDADYSTCDYACIIEKPEFSLTQTAGAAMNEAVEGYLEDLYERVEKQYIPVSIARPPYTEVSCEVRDCGEYTNVIFTEEHCYEAQPYTARYVLMLDGRGSEIGLNDLLRTYHADELLANAVYDRLTESGMAKQGLTVTDVMANIDIFHSCVMDENGVITAYFIEGAVAPYGLGETAVAVDRAMLLPEAVGTILTEEEYYSLCLLGGRLASACVIRENEVDNGELEPYPATAFMGATVQGMGLKPDKGRIYVSAAEFEGVYKAVFGRDFPGLDINAFDIKQSEDGGYAVSSTQKVYSYHLDILDIAEDGDIITVEAYMIYGDYGYAFSAPICRVTLRVAKNAESVYGFTVQDFKLSL